MTERDLASLLKQAADQPPGALDTDQLIRRAGAQRRRQGMVAGLVGLVVLAVVGVGVNQLQRPVGDGAATGGARGSVTDCPPVIKDRNVAVDYVDLVIWSGLQYMSFAEPTSEPTLGEPVTTVGCSVVEITEGGRWHVGPMPWPDRTATFLPSGTQLYAVQGVEPGCQLAAERDGRVVVYTALDPDARIARPLC